MDNRALWGVWCVEMAEWCRDALGHHQTFPSEDRASHAAAAWKADNDWQVAHQVVPQRAGLTHPFFGAGPMVPLRYEVRAYGTAEGAR
jgi:hypothetical protein